MEMLYVYNAPIIIIIIIIIIAHAYIEHAFVYIPFVHGCILYATITCVDTHDDM